MCGWMLLNGDENILILKREVIIYAFHMYLNKKLLRKKNTQIIIYQHIILCSQMLRRHPSPQKRKSNSTASVGQHSPPAPHSLHMAKVGIVGIIPKFPTKNVYLAFHAGVFRERYENIRKNKVKKKKRKKTANPITILKSYRTIEVIDGAGGPPQFLMNHLKWRTYFALLGLLLKVIATLSACLFCIC